MRRTSVSWPFPPFLKVRVKKYTQRVKDNKVFDTDTTLSVFVPNHERFQDTHRVRNLFLLHNNIMAKDSNVRPLLHTDVWVIPFWVHLIRCSAELAADMANLHKAEGWPSDMVKKKSQKSHVPSRSNVFTSSPIQDGLKALTRNFILDTDNTGHI